MAGAYGRGTTSDNERRLAKVEEQQYPLGSRIVLRDIYMDDVLTGADCLPEARRKQPELRELLMAGGFPLRKWASNSKGLLDGLSTDERKGIVEWDSPTHHSVLGIKWLPVSDCFQVTAVMSLTNAGFTKRAVLSGTAQLFDPLGWLARVTIVVKVLMQSLWFLKVDWDTPLPEKEDLMWQQFQNQLPALETIRVPRWLGTTSATQPLEIHGFADASERASAAVVYSRTINAEGVATVSLIVAKSKVAPLKRVSLPRLELCAAFLLARLVEHVTKALDWREVDLHIWSDSSVALSCIRRYPSRWPTYVANRVAEIQRMLSLAQLHHLPRFKLWWRGSEWLSSPDPLPAVPTEETTHEDEELKAHHVTTQRGNTSCTLIEHFSNLTRMFRVLAWCRRWAPGSRKTESVITVTEMQEIKLILLRLEQSASFSEDIANLRRNQPVAAKSRFAKLCPFLDEDGVLRVGGRLQAANLAYDRMHPAILPDESPLAKLWVDAAHKQCLHGGTQLTLATLRQECWILRGHPMNNTESSLFRSGVDYAGPIYLRSGRGRGQLTSKGYIVFICLVTKAVYLEAVSDGSTETFLAALRRRRSIRRSLQGRHFLEIQPPSTPHFGGIWEAAVKSVKHHLRRIIGEQRLTFEELTTLLTGIEACLNSRPLQPLSDDPEHPAALTPRFQSPTSKNFQYLDYLGGS
ncbi:uncharacterized protein LOC143213643 [Lasioglossum baleicum]|uniref:uncharacterized protein LOC143213643 n=1 Tax=Lasioglossum baleicum TaxID=434251 RepID=UPI003FCEAF04